MREREAYNTYQSCELSDHGMNCPQARVRSVQGWPMVGYPRRFGSLEISLGFMCPLVWASCVDLSTLCTALSHCDRGYGPPATSRRPHPTPYLHQMITTRGQEYNRQ